MAKIGFALIQSLYLGSNLVTVTASPWPWTDKCHTDEIAGPGYCRTKIGQDMPDVSLTAIYEVLYLTHWLDADAASSMQTIAKFFQSSIGFREVGGCGEFLFEYWADNLSMNAVIPQVRPKQLDWDDRARITWSPLIKAQEWPRKTSVGYVNGKVLNDFFSWIPTFAKAHPGYQLWSAWDEMMLANRRQVFLQESVSHTFVQDGLAKLFELGADMSSQAPLCRNYFVLPTAKAEAVPASDPDLHSFFEVLASIDTTKSWNEIKSSVLNFIGYMPSPHYYVRNPATEQYFRLDLNEGYANMPLHTVQPMVLPWQSTHTRASSCSGPPAPSPPAPSSASSLPWTQQCNKIPYDYCCTVGVACDCCMGRTNATQCSTLAYNFCCRGFGIPCNCRQPLTTPTEVETYVL